MRKQRPSFLSETFPRICIEGTRLILEPGEGHMDRIVLPPLEDQVKMRRFLCELQRKLPTLAHLLDLALLKHAYQLGRLTKEEQKAIAAACRPLN